MSRAWFLRIEIFAAVVAVAGFLCIHSYQGRVGPLWNVMHGQVLLTDACQPAPQSGAVLNFDDIPDAKGHVIPVDYDPFAQAWWDRCGYHMPYRFVLLWAVVIAAGGFAARRYS